MSRLTREAILETFASYGRPRDTWLVGAEFERHLLRPDGSPLAYGDEHGIRWMFERFAERGWGLHYEGDNPIAAIQHGAWITLEPGCQWELSGTPHPRFIDVWAGAAPFAAQTQEVLDLAGEGVRQVMLGFTPTARIPDIQWVPKGRYVQMREFLIQMGDLAHHMMKGTAAVQVSFDYLDEEDCARKVKLASQLAPLNTALFANSPIAEGKPTGFMSWRGHIWTRTDPQRTGIPNDRHFTYEGWVDYLLDVQMMFILSGGNYVSGRGLTFRQWMAKGIDGQFPTWDDWETHLTQVFPEIRIKRQIEIRGADCVGLPLAGAFCALWQGLYYCNASLRDTLQLAEEFAAEGTKEERFEIAVRDGLQGTISGRKVVDWAREVVALGGRALDACAPLDRHLLEPLERQVDRGVCPARDVLDILPQGMEAVLDASSYQAW
jgi:glutamate--cysteine ligase